MSKGTLFIVSAPSGAGKTSLLKALLKQDDLIRVSLSHTTRAMRPGERDGVDYRFVDQAEFNRMIEAGEFLEHARVFGHSYGTSEAGVRELLEAGLDVVLEIDWQGARQVRERFPDAVSIFVLPPTRKALRERLDARGQDSSEVIEGRMADASREMEHYPEYDYLIINDRFEQALIELGALVLSQRLRVSAQMAGRAAQIRSLLG